MAIIQAISKFTTKDAKMVSFARPATTATAEAEQYNRLGYTMCHRRQHGCILCTCLGCQEKKAAAAERGDVASSSNNNNHNGEDEDDSSDDESSPLKWAHTRLPICECQRCTIGGIVEYITLMERWLSEMEERFWGSVAESQLRTERYGVGSNKMYVPSDPEIDAAVREERVRALKQDPARRRKCEEMLNEQFWEMLKKAPQNVVESYRDFLGRKWRREAARTRAG
ncbi:hypothetical protein MKZ38_010380 [Zalerion maritima]|uniref:Uncharacterized protein n=1 Tax=Zalerion maritima TaxID=339359 RepID=A0AAD5WUI4_9PEZI|nr:hypothetical protein MKZ38_010380 [Zalerion maritima]